MGKNNTQRFAIKTQHKKLYKSGKNWLIGGATFLTFSGVYQFLTPQVHADTTDSSEVDSTNTSSQSANLANSSATSVVTSSSTVNSSVTQSTTSASNSDSSNTTISSFSNTSSVAVSSTSQTSVSSVSTNSSVLSDNSASMVATSSSVDSSSTAKSSTTSSVINSSSNSVANNSSASNSVTNSATSVIASSGTNSVANTDKSLQLFTSKDGQSVLNTSALTTLLNSDSTVKSNVVKQFNLQAVADDDLSNELADRIGDDSSQGQILMSLVNYNPQTSYALTNTLSVSDENNQVQILGSVVSNNSAGTSSTYPQYYVFQQRLPYVVFLPDDNNGNSEINGVSSVTVDSKSLGVTNSTTTQVTNPSAQTVAPGVNVFYHLTRDQAYSTYIQYSGGSSLPMDNNDAYWSASALSGGTRTYTMIVANQAPDQITNNGANPNRYLIGGDYVNYTINTIHNSNFGSGSTYKVAHYYNLSALPTIKVNYQDMNGNAISSSQYLDNGTSVLYSGASYATTVPSMAGYVAYQTSLEPNYSASGSATINSDNSVSINGTVSAVGVLSNFNNGTINQVSNTYDIKYVKPEVRANNKSVTRTVNFVDTNGNKLADSTSQTLNMTQNAVYDSLTNTLLGYLPAGQSSFSSLSGLISSSTDATWNYPSGSQFGSVSAVDLSSQGYQPIDIASVNNESVNPTSTDYAYNIVYNKIPDKTAGFTGKVNRTVTLVDAATGNPISYSGTVNGSTYNNGVLSTSNSQDSDIQPTYGQPSGSSTSNITRVKQYITGYTGTSFTVSLPVTNIPDLSSLGYSSPSMSQVDATTNTFTDSETLNQNYFVKYGHTTVTVDKSDTHNPGDSIPDSTAKYPSGVTLSDLSKTVTREVHYYDGADKQTVVSDPMIESVTFNRVAIVDKVTGQLLGYAKPGTNTVVANDDAWDNANATFPNTPSPNLSLAGYGTPTLQIVGSQSVKSTDNNSVINVYYPHAYQIVHANETKSTNDKIDGTNNHFATAITPDMLNTSTTWTIHYTDKDSGKSVAKDNVATMTFTQAAVVDKVTGDVVTYVNDGTTSVADGSVSESDSPWALMRGTFSDVTSPNLKSAGYINADPSVAKGFSFQPGASNVDTTVTYQKAYSVVYPDGSKNPGDQISGYDAKYGSGATYNDLNKTITRRIHYLDYNDGYVNPNLEISPTIVETVTFKRAAIVDNATGQVVGYSTLSNPKVAVTNPNDAWTTDKNSYDAVKSPDLSSQGYSAPNQAQVDATTVQPTDNSEDLNVLYIHAIEFVNHNYPEDNGDPIFGTTQTYPSGISRNDLDHQINRKIQYRDSQTNELVAPDVFQAITYYRNALVDKVTGKSLGYADNNGKLLSDQSSWLTDNNTFSAVDSPDLTNQGYTVPDSKTVVSQTVKESDSDQLATVKYDHATEVVTADNPKQMTDEIDGSTANYPRDVDKSALNKQITRTIEYQNQRGDTIAKSVVQTTNFTRNALVDKVTGQLLGYLDKNGQTVKNGGDAWTSDKASFDSVNSPDLTSLGYTTPNPSAVTSTPVDVNQDSQTVIVMYADKLMTVLANNGKTPTDTIETTTNHYPSGVSTADLNQIITRTIQYVDESGKPLQNSTVQTAHFTRNAVVNEATGQFVKYTDWQSTDNQLSALSVPTINGYQVDGTPVIDKLTLSLDNGNITQVIRYHKVTNQTPKHQYQIVYGNQGDLTNLPAGLTASDLHRVVKRTINYLNDSGQQVASSVVQTMNFYRNAIVDTTTNQLVGYTNGSSITPLTDANTAWYSVDNRFSAVGSPDLTSDGYQQASPVIVEAMSVAYNTQDSTVNVLYHKTAVVSQVPTSQNYVPTSAVPTSKVSHHKSHGKSVVFSDGPYADMPKHSDAKMVKPEANHGDSVVWRSKSSDKAVAIAKATTNAVKSKTTSHTSQTLPQTGHSDEDAILELIGLLALLTSGLYLGLSAKKKFE